MNGHTHTDRLITLAVHVHAWVNHQENIVSMHVARHMHTSLRSFYQVSVCQGEPMN